MKSYSIIICFLTINVGYRALAEEEKQDKGEDINLGDMLQMGMQLGKTFLGDEGMEKVKKGDLSEIMNLGKQFLGEETMNDIITGVADQFIQMKDLKIKTSDKKENTDEKVVHDKIEDEL